MILCLGAAICVGAIVIANPSSPVAQPADQNQNKLNATAMGPAIRGIASTYNPFRPGYRSGGKDHMIQPPGPRRSKPICVTGLVVSAMEGIIGRHTR